MTRLWTAPAVAGVLTAVVVVWLLRAATVLATGGSGAEVVSAPSVYLLHAAGPAVLCAVPLVLLARAVLARTERSPRVLAALGLAGGVVVGLVQSGVLLAAWPWELGPGLARDLVVVPAVGGLAGGVVAAVVADVRDQEPPRR